MALAGDDQNLARRQVGDGGRDRLAPVGDFRGAGGGGQDFGADLIGVLAARIVVGDDDAIGQIAGDAAHFRAFSLVSVAAAAEHHGERARRMRAQRRQHVFQGIRGMGVIHIDRAARGLFADPFHAPGRTR